MFKYLILLAISLRLTAADYDAEADYHTEIDLTKIFFEPIVFELEYHKAGDDARGDLPLPNLLDLDYEAKAQEKKPKRRLGEDTQTKGKHSKEFRTDNPRVTKKARHLHFNDVAPSFPEQVADVPPLGGLSYLDVDDKLIAGALKALAKLPGCASETVGLSMHSKKVREAAFTSLKTGKLAPFEALFRALVDKILETETPNGRTLVHMAIRVDLDCSVMGENLDRRFTQGWHSHGDDGRYIFALTLSENLTTMVEVAGIKQHIEKNRLFLLPGPMSHRTPDSAKGKRIQLSLGLMSVEDES